MAEFCSEEIDSSAYLILQDAQTAPPTPCPRAPRGEESADPLAPAGEEQVHQLFGEEAAACTYQEFCDHVRSLLDEKDRKDIVTMQRLPQLMKDTLFVRSQEMLESCQEKVKAKPSNEEEQKKFLKLVSSVIGDPLLPKHHEKAQKLLDILNNASLIASNGHTSLKSSNKVFQKLFFIFKDACEIGGEEVEVNYEPLSFLKTADQCSKLRQKHLQNGQMEEAEKCLSDAMDNIVVCVGKAELQHGVAEQRYSEVVRANKHISVKNLEMEIGAAMQSDGESLSTVQKRCEEDRGRMDRASNTLDKIYSGSKQHFKQLDDIQIKELEKNKQEQALLESRLRALRDSAKQIDAQRDHAKRQNKSAERAYNEARKKVSVWQDNVSRLQTQTQHAQSVLALVEEGCTLVVEDFYQTHQLYLEQLNRVSVEALQLYRRCLVGRIVASRFRLQELETNVSTLDALLQPKKEDLKKQRMTGLKMMVDKTEKEVKELSEYKMHYMSAKQSLEHIYAETDHKLKAVDAAIYKRVPDTKLSSVDTVYEDERAQHEAEWENLEIQSLSKNFQ